ncbi:MAG: hypothetical protein ABIU30_18510 [Ferruginibacter sp.]
MKKLFLSVALLITANAFAQPFIGIGATNRGANLQAGILAEKVELTFAAKIPFTRVDIPTVLSLTAGKQFLLSNKDEDNYSLTTSLGIASHTIKDFTKYNADETGASPIITVNTIRIIYGLEIGKDSYLGRFYVAANYCHGFYYGVGIRIFPYRN